jgi:lipopolysaccharide export LptBFGC system permease protein LptF
MRKKIIIGVLVLVAIGVAVFCYFFFQKFENTANLKPDYTVAANIFLAEYSTDSKRANEKYTQKIVQINGRVSETELADTVVNIKMIDTTGNYIIFAFQKQDIAKAKTVNAGDSVSIKGSCSGGVYSEILEVNYIAFKRCSLNK